MTSSEELLAGADRNVLPILCDLISQKIGLHYANGREFLLYDKLAPLVEESKLGSLLDYYYFLKYSLQAQEEWRRLQGALAVNESYFFRENDQIQAAARLLVPDLMQRHPDSPVRIWHAGSASGEEPYSMAMMLYETGVYLGGPVEIVATDFSEDALAVAKRAIYRTRSFRSMPSGLYERYFTQTNNGQHKLADWVADKVQFRYLNLMDDSAMEEMRDFDIIFCRNVFIYFNHEAIKKTVTHFYRALKTPGYLFVAAAESLLRFTTSFNLAEVDGAFMYEKESQDGIQNGAQR